MARIFLLSAVMLVVPLGGCLDPPQEAVAPATTVSLLSPSEVTPTGVVHEWELFLHGGTDLEVGGRHPFTLTYMLKDGEPAMPGPELRVRQGDTVRVITNGHHTIHWHGVRVPWEMDGVPGMTQTLGDGVFTYEFVAKDAGTFWYHCHVAAPEHVDRGMFGALIVEPADPSDDPPFDREYTLFLHEIDTKSYAVSDFVIGTAFEGDLTPETLTNVPNHPVDAVGHVLENAATLTNGAQEAVPFLTGMDRPTPSRGYRPQYDLFMINGKVFPDTEPIGITSEETIRIRLINAGQLVHSMHLHGHRFLVTHKDGALLPNPYLADTIGLFPGERYDIYVRGDNPGHWDFHDHGGSWGVGAYAATDAVSPGGMHTMLVYDDWTPPAKLPGPSPHTGHP